ncbi:MAG: RNA 3'-terminal phosphate cyclase [Planctomycetota bacterium]|jgi:RNA 3'-terminal phosphate cyclase (ATP)
MSTVLIDGSEGEGGGQILRTSLTLSCITGKALRIENIRAARRNPGLAKQHLVCTRAACEISKGRCRGDALRSQTLDFEPGPVRSGDYHFDIGSAGSASLVAQTVLPALFGAYKPSRVTVTGGTHNSWAPPYDFLKETFLPAISAAGFSGHCKLIRHGFYPAGGGKMTFRIEPGEQPTRAIELCSVEGKSEIHARIYTTKLPAHIARRQEELLLVSGLDISDVEHIDAADSQGPGNCIMIRLLGAGRTIVFTAFGQKGKPSKKVVAEAVTQAQVFLASGAAVDRYLADQLLIYMAISGTGAFTTSELSNHLLTNIEVIKQFLPVEFGIVEEKGMYRVSCQSA